MVNDKWNIMRLYGGYGDRKAAQNFIGPEHLNEVYRVPYWSFAVWNDSCKIMVDTAVNDEDRHLWYTDVPNIIAEHERLPEQLKAALGWSPEDVDIVINTHLHWDHTGYNYIFKNAEFYVQRSEYEFGITHGQTPGFGNFYKKSNFDKNAVPYHRWHFLEGEQQILPGIVLFPAPGHGKCMQAALIYTTEGEVCIAGDAVNTLYSIQNNLLTPAMMDPSGQLATYEKIRQIADKIITSHDIPGEHCYDHQTSDWQPL